MIGLFRRSEPPGWGQILWTFLVAVFAGIRSLHEEDEPVAEVTVSMLDRTLARELRCNDCYTVICNNTRTRRIQWRSRP